MRDIGFESRKDLIFQVKGCSYYFFRFYFEGSWGALKIALQVKTYLRVINFKFIFIFIEQVRSRYFRIGIFFIFRHGINDVPGRATARLPNIIFIFIFRSICSYTL
jgi:hypothetical protein